MRKFKSYSPLPWRPEFEKGGTPGGAIFDATGKHIAAYGTSRMDTLFIATACNTHERLLVNLNQLVHAGTKLFEAAMALDAAIDGVTDQFDDGIADLQKAMRDFRAAVLNAQAGAP